MTYTPRSGPLRRYIAALAHLSFDGAEDADFLADLVGRLLNLWKADLPPSSVITPRRGLLDLGEPPDRDQLPAFLCANPPQQSYTALVYWMAKGTIESPIAIAASGEQLTKMLSAAMLLDARDAGATESQLLDARSTLYMHEADESQRLALVEMSSATLLAEDLAKKLPLVSLAQKTKSAQAARARLPRTPLLGDRDETTLSEVIERLKITKQREDLSVKELWAKLLGILDELGAEPRESGSLAAHDPSNGLKVQYTTSDGTTRTLKYTSFSTKLSKKERDPDL